jgi:hypothetical protein
MLSTAPGGSKEKLAYHHRLLRESIGRKYGFKGIQYFCVQTDEGNGVLHIVWAWKGEPYFAVEKEWLNDEWERIHGAKITWIKAVSDGEGSRARIGKYCITQYCAEQSGFVRFSYSWWLMPYAISSSWERLKRLGRDTYQGTDFKWRTRYTVSMSELVAAWEELIENGSAILNGSLVEFQGRALVEVF